MTIETQESKVIYQGDGAALVFPVPFPVRRAEHLRLYLAAALDREIVMEEAEYEVDGVDTGAVSVTLSAPLPSGRNLAIVRLVPLVQQMDLENGGSFDAETIESQMDILEMQIQQLQEQVNRTIRIPRTSGRDPDDFWRDLLEAHRATLATYGAMLELFDAQALDSYAVNVRRSTVLKEAVPAGEVVTLPVWYYPGRNILYLSVDGMVCTPRLPDNADQSERQYEEMGDDANALSNQVRVHFPIEAGGLVDAWVVSSNHAAYMGRMEEMCAEAALQADRARSLVDPAALASQVYNIRRAWLATEDVAAGEVLELQGPYYPGRDVLSLRIRSVPCTPRHALADAAGAYQYEEMGDDPNALSYAVRVSFDVKAGDLVDMHVIASGVSLREFEELVAAADAASAAASEAQSAAELAAVAAQGAAATLPGLETAEEGQTIVARMVGGALVWVNEFSSGAPEWGALRVTLDSGLAAGTLLTVPRYVAGSNKIHVYYGGVLCDPGSSAATAFYRHIGGPGEQSTAISFFETLPAGGKIAVIVAA